MKIIFFYYYYDDKIKDKKRVEFPPLGMLYLCSALEKSGCDVEVKYFDENTKIADIPNADIYAYSISSTASYPTYLQLAEKLKEKAKYHIAGNTQATIFPEQVLKQMNLDAVFTGEGEETVTNWIKNGCQQKGIINGERVDIRNLPFPARHLIPDDKIYMNNRVGGKSKNSISMISSRGCVFGCKFCAIQNRCKKYFIKPEYNNFTNISNKVRQNLLEESRQLNLFGGMDDPVHKEYERIPKPEYISGEIQATVGSLILLKSGVRYSVVNMKTLEGWLVDFKKREIFGEEPLLCRTDAPIGQGYKMIRGRDVKLDDINNYLKEVKECTEDGVILISKHPSTMLTGHYTPRYRTNGAIMVVFEKGDRILIDYVGPGFDVGDITRGKTVHTAIQIPWDSIYEKPIHNYKDVKMVWNGLFQINDEYI